MGTMAWYGMAVLLIVTCVIIWALVASRPARARTAILNGSQLDFVPPGTDMYRIFRSKEPPFHDALYDVVRPVVHVDGVTHATIAQTCTALYADGVRIFTGMLESELLVALAPFARSHPDALVLSASSSIPRAGVLPKNVFRLYPNDRDLYHEVRKVVADRFGTHVSRAVLVNGSPGNLWSDAVQMILHSMQRGTAGEEAGTFTVTEAMTTAEQGGAAAEDTVYIYAGEQAGFNLADHFTTGEAHILIVSGTGWTFPVTAVDNPYTRNQVYSLDMINSTKFMHAAMLRLHTPSIWPGYLLHAMHLATELDGKWNGTSSLTDLCESMYGLGGHRVFNADHDGIADGGFTNRVTGTCDSCLFSVSWPSVPDVGPAFSFVEDTFGSAVSVTAGLLDTPITCGTQIAACSVAVAERDATSLASACTPLVDPTVSGGQACISLATGISSACLHDLTLCGQGNHEACRNGTATCTLSMLTQSASQFASNVIDMVPFI